MARLHKPGATRFALAPGFHIPRLWRCIPPIPTTFEAKELWCSFHKTSERQFHAGVKNPTSAAYRIRHRRVTHRGPVDVERFVVPADNLVFERKEIYPGAKVTWLAELTKDLGDADVSLERFRYHHRRTLDLESMVEQLRRH